MPLPDIGDHGRPDWIIEKKPPGNLFELGPSFFDDDQLGGW